MLILYFLPLAAICLSHKDQRPRVVCVKYEVLDLIKKHCYCTAQDVFEQIAEHKAGGGIYNAQIYKLIFFLQMHAEDPDIIGI